MKTFLNNIAFISIGCLLILLNSFNVKEIQAKECSSKNIYSKDIVYNPETLGIWMETCLEYQKDEKGYWKSPKETLSDGGGDCEDLSILAKSVLSRLGYKGHLIAVIYKNWRGKRVGHAIYLFEETSGTWSYFSNQYYIKRNYKNKLAPIKRDFTSWTDIVFITTKGRILKHIKRKVK